MAISVIPDKLHIFQILDIFFPIWSSSYLTAETKSFKFFFDISENSHNFFLKLRFIVQEKKVFTDKLKKLQKWLKRALSSAVSYKWKNSAIINISTIIFMITLKASSVRKIFKKRWF